MKCNKKYFFSAAFLMWKYDLIIKSSYSTLWVYSAWSIIQAFLVEIMWKWYLIINISITKESERKNHRREWGKWDFGKTYTQIKLSCNIITLCLNIQLALFMLSKTVSRNWQCAWRPWQTGSALTRTTLKPSLSPTLSLDAPGCIKTCQFKEPCSIV